jgi:hypothetical protein
MVQLEVTNRAEVSVLAHLHQIEITQGEDAMPTHTSGLGTRVFDLVGVRHVCNVFLKNSKFIQLYH